jgi:hypothetical protein
MRQQKNCWTRRFQSDPCRTKESRRLVLPRTSCYLSVCVTYIAHLILFDWIIVTLQINLRISQPVIAQLACHSTYRTESKPNNFINWTYFCVFAHYTICVIKTIKEGNVHTFSYTTEGSQLYYLCPMPLRIRFNQSRPSNFGKN